MLVNLIFNPEPTNRKSPPTLAFGLTKSDFKSQPFKDNSARLSLALAHLSQDREEKHGSLFRIFSELTVAYY